MPKFAKAVLVLWFALLILGSAIPALAQDPGVPDSVWTECVMLGGDSLLIDVMVFADSVADTVLVGVVYPMLLTVSNNALVTMDTTLKVIYGDAAAGQLPPTLLRTFSNRAFGYAGGDGDTIPSLSPYHFQVGAVDFALIGVAGNGVMAHILIKTNGDTATITLDTLSGNNPPRFTNTFAEEYTPKWGGPDTCWATDVRDYKPREAGRPTTYTLNQNFPNPFNASTVIRFALPQASHVRLEVFNVLGQKVNTLVDDDLSAGFKEVMWDGKDQSGSTVASGIYFYRIKAGDRFTNLKKMILIK